MKNIYKSQLTKLLAILLFFLMGIKQEIYATAKIALSGNWASNATWIPLGIPGSGDEVTIPIGVTVTMNQDLSVKKLTIEQGGTLIFTPGKKLNILDDFIVKGLVNMNGGNIDMQLDKKFEIGANGTFIFDPGNNSLAGASVITKGKESFDAASTLIIKKWFDYNVPLTNYMNGDFGNLTLNSIVGSTIYEWDMNNGFKDFQVKGTLTVDQCWLTFDKSGLFAKTTMGNITLTGLNSTLYLHSGNHPGIVELEVTNIVNNGTFYALYNGNGNVKLVAENFTNNANVKLAFNDGIWSVGNNFVEMEVKTSYVQNFGDFRGIYNLSSSNSGYYTFKFKNITLNGGVFMGSYGISLLNLTCKFEVTEFLKINYNLASDKFRGIGLSTLSGFVNNSKLNLIVRKSIIVNGNINSEIISSSSNGTETIAVDNNIESNGCNTSFNYGSSIAAHTVNMDIGGKIKINGGILNLSRLAGDLVINLADIDLLSGTLNLKNNDGLSTVNMVGNYLQTGGTLNLKNNTLIASVSPITFVIKGNFTFTNGTINFDDNSNGVNHIIDVRAPIIDISGGLFSGPTQNFGIINYSLLGTLKLKRSANNSIQNVKQYIKAGCTLEMLTGNLLVAGLVNPTGDNLVVENGGVLNIANKQIVSNGAPTGAVVRVESGGRIKTTNTMGLYNGTMNATISSSGNMDYWLDENSTIEYNAMMNQKLTGLNPGINDLNHHKYGNLEINLGTTFGLMNAAPGANNVYVRNKLILNSGELNLNGFALTVENGAMDAISRTNGYIVSETNQNFNPSILVWENLSLGAHIIPFGKNSSTFIPVTFDVKMGAGNNMTISTRATTIDNQPFSLSTMGAAATSIMNNGIDISLTDVIDRYWVINANGITADVTFNYSGIENTLISALRSGNISPLVLYNGQWDLQSGFRNGTTSSTGYVIGKDINKWGTFILSSTTSPLPIQLINFNAIHNTGKVYLDWSTATETDNDFFTIEKSKDGQEFTFVSKVKGAGNSNSLKKYTSVDNNPWTGVTYYRLKQTDFDGKFKYSELVSVNIGASPITQLDVKSVAPNPFRDRIETRYNVVEAGEVKIQLFSLKGQLMKAEKYQAEKGMNESVLNDLDELSPGVYVLNVLYNGIAVTHKVIKN